MKSVEVDGRYALVIECNGQIFHRPCQDILDIDPGVGDDGQILRVEFFRKLQARPRAAKQRIVKKVQFQLSKRSTTDAQIRGLGIMKRKLRE